MIAGRCRRRFVKHGGSLCVAVPSQFAARMGVKNGDEAWVTQPFTDLICVFPGDRSFAEADGPSVRGIVSAVLDGSVSALRELIGGFPTAAPTACSVCNERGAVFTYTTVNVCPPCERELAACWLHRLSPSPDERHVDGS